MIKLIQINKRDEGMIVLDKSNFICSVMTKTRNDPLFKTDMTFPGSRLCYIVQGNAVWRINGVDRRVGAGDIVAFNEMQRRRFTDHGETELKLFIMQFDRNAFADRRYYHSFGRLIKATDCVIKNEMLSNVVKEIFTEATGDGKGKYDLISAKMTEFFIKAQRLYLTTDQADEANGKMIGILDRIEEKAGIGVSLSEAARTVGLSESAFSRSFSKHFGISFKRYIMIKKTEKAVKLLKTTDLKVVDVAYECGFNSISGFYDTFKKITGTTPDKILSVI